MIIRNMLRNELIYEGSNASKIPVIVTRLKNGQNPRLMFQHPIDQTVRRK